MKKTIITLMGLFALVACSEDAYQEVDEVNSSIVESNNQSNVKTPFTVSAGYSSPWDQYSRTMISKTVPYVISNTTYQLNPAKQLIFKVIPYLGLAYYDGIQNGIYTDLESGTPIANMTTPPYSNLYAGGKEIGNFIPAFPLTLTGDGGTEADIAIMSTTHCPVLDGSAGVSSAGRYFNIPNTFATSAERLLLANYGKVFFYYWEAVDPVTVSVVARGYIKPSCDENSDTSISPVVLPVTGPLNVTVPNLPLAPTTANVYMHTSAPPIIPVVPPTPPYPLPTVNQSRELILQQSTYRSVGSFLYNGEVYYVRCFTTSSAMWLTFDF